MRVVMRGSAGVSVFEPFKGSPAFKSGLRPGDLIIMINETNTRGMNTEKVAELLKGPRGTTVKIEVVLREDLVQRAIETVQKAAKTGKIGDGKIFILPIEEAVRIRTEERGEKAV